MYLQGLYPIDESCKYGQKLIPKYHQWSVATDVFRSLLYSSQDPIWDNQISFKDSNTALGAMMHNTRIAVAARREAARLYSGERNAWRDFKTDQRVIQQ